MKRLLMLVSRMIGRCVCAIRDHRFFYANGTFDSWKAYSCVRCCALSRPLESLEYAPDDDDDCVLGFEDEEQIALDHLSNSRWFRWLPFPRWL